MSPALNGSSALERFERSNAIEIYDPISNVCGTKPKSLMCTKTKHTVDLEIFIVKIFSWFAQTTKIKKNEIYFTVDNIYISTVSQHS